MADPTYSIDFMRLYPWFIQGVSRVHQLTTGAITCCSLLIQWDSSWLIRFNPLPTSNWVNNKLQLGFIMVHPLPTGVITRCNFLIQGFLNPGFKLQMIKSDFPIYWGYLKNGWFIKENPTKTDDLGGTPILGNHQRVHWVLGTPQKRFAVGY